MLGYQVECHDDLLMMVIMTTTAVLISFALQMDKTLHPTTTLRVYYIITVTGEF